MTSFAVIWVDRDTAQKDIVHHGRCVALEIIVLEAYLRHPIRRKRRKSDETANVKSQGIQGLELMAQSR